MSTRKTTHVDGDVQVENNVVVGGDGSISGGMTVGHNLKVEGWLEARNIRGVNKGVFPTYEALVAKYSEPQDGWYAGVAVTTDGETVFEFYLAQKGRWVDMESTIDSAIEVGTLQRDVEEMQEAVRDAEEELLARIHGTSLASDLSSGKPAIINGVINGQGQWIASGQGFSDCLVVPIIAGETIVVTYSEDVSLIDRSFFKSFDAETKEIVFAEGYSGIVSNNGTYRVVTRVAPDDASFFYTAYNRTKIISITVGGVEVYASTPASRLLQEELHVADLSGRISAEATARADSDEELLARIQGNSLASDATSDPFRKWPAPLTSWGDVDHALDVLMSISGSEQGQKAAGRWRLVYNGRVIHVDMYAQDFEQGYWVQVVSGAIKISETSATELELGHSNRPHTYWRRNYDNFVGDIGGQWCEVSASPSALANTYLSGGKPAIINGVINGQGQWIASGQGFSDCLVVPIIAGETIVVTYSEDVSLIDRSFFKSFDAETKEIVFAEGYSGIVSNNGTYRVVTRVAPDDASFFYTAYNRTKIISITVGGVEVYASTPASRLLQEELHVADLSRQALRTSDLTLSVGSNLADKDAITTGYVSTAGSLVNSQDWKRVAINVKEIPSGTQLTFGGFHLGRTGYYAFYGSGSKISNGSYADPNGSTAPVTVTVPPGADTLYVTIFREGNSTTPEGWTTPYDELTCSRGTTLQPFVPYVKVVTAIKGYALAGTSQGSGGSGGGVDIVADLPLAPDGAGIETGYAYIDSITGAVKVKLSQTEQL